MKLIETVLSCPYIILHLAKFYSREQEFYGEVGLLTTACSIAQFILNSSRFWALIYNSWSLDEEVGFPQHNMILKFQGF